MKVAINLNISTALSSGFGFNPLRLFSAGEQGVWFEPSPTTCFTDTAGTTPAQVGQAVALMLDKSEGLVLGPELVTNGDFSDGTTGWLGTNATLSVVSGRLRVTDAGASSAAYQQISVIAGRTYRLTLDYLFPSSNAATDYEISVRASTFGGAVIVERKTGLVEDTETNLSLLFTPSVSTVFIRLSPSSVTGDTADFDNITVRELPGNHATQATLAARPILARVPASGRRNLLVRTEEFDNAAWIRGVTGTASAPVVTTNAAVAPDETATASLVQLRLNGATDSSVSWFYQNLFVPSGATRTTSFYVKAANAGDVGKTIRLTGTLSTPVTLTAGWQRVSNSALLVTGATISFGVRLRGTEGTSDSVDLHLWGGQVDDGSVATNYQRVSSTFDVTEAGQPDNFYLSFDGVDDSMSTPSINFTSTDKMTVFAGVRNLNATVAVIAELSPSTATNNGAFILAARENLANYFFGSKGTVGSDARTPANYPQPITNILASIGDISGDLAALRVDGTQAAQSTTDQGTGNYGNYQMFIGSRAGTSLRLNGQLYSLIVRGAQTDLPTIQRTERYVAAKTAGVSL
jgi:hypothetical protein